MMCFELDFALLVRNRFRLLVPKICDHTALPSFTPRSKPAALLFGASDDENYTVYKSEKKKEKREKYTIYGKVDDSRKKRTKESKKKNEKGDRYTIYGKVAEPPSAYNIFGKLESEGIAPPPPDDSIRPLLRNEEKRKRRAVKRALGSVFRSVKGKTTNLIFSEIDKDNDGKLSKEELMEFAESGRLSDPLAEVSFMEDLEKMNGDAPITKKDFDKAIASSNPDKISEVVFETLDSDHDGMLSRDELSTELVGENGFNILDENNDGFIDKKEFEEALLSSKNGAKEIDQTSNDSGVAKMLENTMSELEPLERQSFRMEGFDPYILVSVLTAGESFDVINSNVANWNDLAMKTSFLQLTQEDWFSLVLLATAAASTLMGAYAAVTFSLTVLYGKTALGLDKDEAYYEFLDETGLQRFRGFQAFTWSLGLFCVIVFLKLFQKSPSVVRPEIAGLALYLLYLGRKEYNFIISKAGPIFAPKSVAKLASEDDDNNE